MEFVTPIESHLRNSGMYATRDWLQECIEYFCEQIGNSRVDLNELSTQVKQQWLLSDLREISPGCLPSNLNNEVKTNVNGIYALQLDHILDIGTPAYQQLQKLDKIDTTNIEVTNNSSDPPPQRILKLYFTDGFQNVSGIEYKPMRNLTTYLTPGIKIQIKGPVDCRRGVLMLEEKHILVLGGEVENLLESNNYKNVLKREIEHDNTTGSNTSNFIRDKVKLSNQITQTTISNNTNVTKNNFKPEIKPQIETNSIKEEVLNLSSEMFEDDIFEDQIINQVQLIENQMKDKKDKSPLASTSHNTYSSKFYQVNVMKNEGIMNFNEYTEKFSPKIIIDKYIDDDIFIESNEVFTNATREDFHDSPSSKKPKIEYPIKVDKNPFIYIKQLLDIPDELKSQKLFIVKAQILKVVGKLSCNGEKWILKCTLVDGSGLLDVNMESQLLSIIFGITPEKITSIKKRISSEPNLKNMLRDILGKAIDQMQKMDCLFHITYRNNEPYVTETVELNQTHLNQLKQRSMMIS